MFQVKSSKNSDEYAMVPKNSLFTCLFILPV